MRFWVGLSACKSLFEKAVHYIIAEKEGLNGIFGTETLHTDNSTSQSVTELEIKAHFTTFRYRRLDASYHTIEVLHFDIIQHFPSKFSSGLNLKWIKLIKLTTGHVARMKYLIASS